MLHSEIVSELKNIGVQVKPYNVQDGFMDMFVNGEVRQAFGTLLQSHIDYTPNGTGHAASRDCIRYWDEEKGAWRQFKAYNFLRVA